MVRALIIIPSQARSSLTALVPGVDSKPDLLVDSRGEGELMLSAISATIPAGIFEIVATSGVIDLQEGSFMPVSHILSDEG